MLNDDQRSKIRNVIIVIMENRSFDHMLGYLSQQASGYANWHAIEGVRQALAAGYVNRNPEGKPVAPESLDLFWNAAFDPPHERDPVGTQLGAPSAQGVFPMDGFVRSYYEANRNTVEPGVVGYYGPREVATFDFFAKNFLVCDHWFAPLPTSTQPNRLMSLSGYALRDYTSSVPDVADQNLVYDWLGGKAPFAVYSEGHPFVCIIPARIPRVLSSGSFHNFDELDPASLPPVTFIEPRSSSWTSSRSLGASRMPVSSLTSRRAASVAPSPPI
jgi:phospholipase C